MATRSRTKDYKEFRRDANHSNERRQLSLGSDIEMGDIGSGFERDDQGNLLASADNMAAIATPTWMTFSERATLDMETIQSKMRELAKLHISHLKPGFDEAARKAEEQKIEILTADITKLFRQCEKSIMALGDPTIQSTKQELKLRSNIQKSNAMALQELSVDFRKAQRDYLKRLKANELGLTTGMASSSSSSTMLGDDDLDVASYDRGFTLGQMEVLDDNSAMIREREEEIAQIASSIEDLAMIFKELSILVVDQGTLIDRIDYNVEQAVGHTAQAVNKLRSASASQKRYRNKICILLLLILCGGMALILIVRSASG